jgi:hypothetical protein
MSHFGISIVQEKKKKKKTQNEGRRSGVMQHGKTKDKIR